MATLNFKPLQYDDEARIKRAVKKCETLERLVGLRGKRVLEVGPHMGDMSRIMARDYDCEVVGIDPMGHETWPAFMEENPGVRLIQGDMASPPDDLADKSFDLICSFVVWEHVRHPWSALKNCQRLLKDDGKKYMIANLYRSAIASHLYTELKDPWPHLMFSPRELEVRLAPEPLHWAFWVNKLTYQQYLFYFRQLGFFVTHEEFHQSHFSREYYDAHEQKLGLYPEWDLSTDFFEVVLEFDADNPRVAVPDPVYRLRPSR